MKFQLSISMLFLGSFIFPCQMQSKKMIRVHCDVNKTLICTDAVQGKDLEEMINGILAEFTFYKWDGKNIQSYYAFVSAKLLRENSDSFLASEKFKKLRRELLKGFPQYLERYPELQSSYQATKDKMTALLSSEEMVIFPSFIKLIGWLNTCHKDHYTIYLRTFGQDLPKVMSLIEKRTELKFAAQGEFNGRALSLAEESYLDFFRNSKNNYGIKDDFEYWKSKGFQAEGGKPFPVGLNAEDIEILLDDNADDEVKPIICPVNSEGKLLNTAELLKKGIIVAVNPMEAILDEDYFIKKVQARINSNH